jgi:transposase InsO family protein
VAFLVRRHKVCERRACEVIGQHRSTQRYVPVPGDFEQRLVKSMRQLAEAHPRYGYRRVHALLVAEGWNVNVKRIHRLWVLEQLKVPPRKAKDSGKRAQGADTNSAWALPAIRPNHVWSYDFVAARTDDGGPLRILNVVDEYTRQCKGTHVARSIGAAQVKRCLDKLFALHGKPAIIRSDNGREFISETVTGWLAHHGVTAAFIAKASPQQNCYVERFNGTMRDELLNGELFHTLLEARVVITNWVDSYNASHPHRSLGMMSPDAFAAAALTTESTH